MVDEIKLFLHATLHVKKNVHLIYYQTNYWDLFPPIWYEYAHNMYDEYDNLLWDRGAYGSGVVVMYRQLECSTIQTHNIVEVLCPY